jgi:hypothetical protein
MRFFANLRNFFLKEAINEIYRCPRRSSLDSRRFPSKISICASQQKGAAKAITGCAYFYFIAAHSYCRANLCQKGDIHERYSAASHRPPEGQR